MRNQRGQISIFFSASLVVFISIVAFVINVGLFVKAKINLQNATDAAAFAGAAVQSRQLTKIAYLNWEMRNIYKEWMYKYYVIGSLNLPKVENPAPKACSSGGPCMDYRLAADKNVIPDPPVITPDPYNFPATCIHIANTSTNICRNFGVPGLPEFGGSSMAGTEEASRSFQDVLVGGKVEDCVTRSRLNMLVNTIWAYNVLASDMGSTLTAQGPAILANRQGAWPKALELAMRIRNLEKVVNRAAVTDPVSISKIGDFESANLLGNERIVKAFYSGYRNLGNHIDDEMKNSFTLKELPPKEFKDTSIYSNSNLLIPNNRLYPKQYLDLKLMMVNYATFFAAFVPRADKGSSAACGMSKVAVPVPGYPLGYYKNPDVLTYYAVRGEAEFEGMFNPFSTDTIKLTAYSAAKPAGGRIGPMLFAQKASEQAIRPRGGNRYRSVPYIASLNVEGTPNRYVSGGLLQMGKYASGAPLPIDISDTKRFWIKDENSPVGGLATGEDVQFGIPNLVYDFVSAGGVPTSSMDPNVYSDQGSKLFVIKPQSDTNDKSVGLFNYDQFMAFKGQISGIITPQMLEEQINRVKAATRYEAANYLIPTPHDFNIGLKVDSYGTIGGKKTSSTLIPGLDTYHASIYAPLYTNNQQDILFPTEGVVLSSIVQFMKAQKSGIDNYIRSMNRAAIETYQTTGLASLAAEGAKPLYEKAAKGISDINVKDTDPLAYVNAFPRSCGSLAGQFYEFYYGHATLFPTAIADKTSTPCPTHLVELLSKYFTASANDPNYSPLHYKMDYNYYAPNWEGTNSKTDIFSAYTPGPYTGAGQDGTLTPPFPGLNSELMRRNFYSTKLVTINSLRVGGKYDETSGNSIAILSEGDLNTPGGKDYSQAVFANPLETSTEPGLENIKY